MGSAHLFMFLKVGMDIPHSLLELFLFMVVEAYECCQTVLALQDSDLIVKGLYLLVDVLGYLVGFFLVVEVVLGVALLDLLEDFSLVFLEHVLYLQVDFLLALR